jgi:hypothetical protein
MSRLQMLHAFAQRRGPYSQHSSRWVLRRRNVGVQAQNHHTGATGNLGFGVHDVLNRRICSRL